MILTKSYPLLFLLLISPILSQANNLSHFLHQYKQYANEGTPCWHGLSKEESDLIKSRIQSCSANEGVQVANGPWREIHQELIFNLAREHFNEKNYCLEQVLISLQNKDFKENKKFYEFWLNKNETFISGKI